MVVFHDAPWTIPGWEDLFAKGCGKDNYLISSWRLDLQHQALLLRFCHNVVEYGFCLLGTPIAFCILVKKLEVNKGPVWEALKSFELATLIWCSLLLVYGVAYGIFDPQTFTPMPIERFIEQQFRHGCLRAYIALRATLYFYWIPLLLWFLAYIHVHDPVPAEGPTDVALAQ